METVKIVRAGMRRRGESCSEELADGWMDDGHVTIYAGMFSMLYCSKGICVQGWIYESQRGICVGRTCCKYRFSSACLYFHTYARSPLLLLLHGLRSFAMGACRESSLKSRRPNHDSCISLSRGPPPPPQDNQLPPISQSPLFLLHRSRGNENDSCSRQRSRSPRGAARFFWNRSWAA